MLVPHCSTLKHQNDSSPDTSIPTPPNPPVSPQPAAPSGKPSPIQHQPPPYSTSIIVKEDSTVSTSQPTRLKASKLPKFYGRYGDDFVDWVQKISSIKRGSQANDSDILRLLDSLLHSNTFDYYVCLSEKEHSSFNTWNAWSKELQKRFLPPNCLDDLKENNSSSHPTVRVVTPVSVMPDAQSRRVARRRG
ncbi:hypothetical protein LQV05_005597 [Cryptococcus neoformans]|nr:hypothetical protein LQV05_005597 [Cryptococcus neoformans]